MKQNESLNGFEGVIRMHHHAEIQDIVYQLNLVE